MRFQARNVEQVTAREQWRRDRAAARTLRETYPSVTCVHVQLSFEQPAGPPPAAQAHVLHPPARAFFEFPCPYANCGGKFDLSTPARRTIERAVAQIASASRITGKVECTGERATGSGTKQPCGLWLTYTIAVEPEPKSGSGT